jgi:hypothetical protein
MILGGDHELSVLDVATGTGFPAEQLYGLGYTNLTLLDGDPTLAEGTTRRFVELGINIPVGVEMWQTLTRTVRDPHDVVLIAENSLIAVDGWFEGQAVTGFEAVTRRLRETIEQFYAATSDHGRCLIGHAKRYKPGAQGSYYEGIYDHGDEEVKIIWVGEYDWETRVNTWTSTIEGPTVYGQAVRPIYIVTSDELTTIMYQAGFHQVEIVTIDECRDNILVGYK